jgi:hypothetical protein
VGRTPTIAFLDAALVYHWIDGNVYRKLTGGQPAMMQLGDSGGFSSLSADYHQKSSVKTPTSCHWRQADWGHEASFPNASQ